MALITGLGLITVSILTAALSRILAEEMGAWSPSITRSLIKLAVRRLPEHQRERFEEEWQSHVNDVPGHVVKLFVAVGFIFAAYDISINDQCKTGHERLAHVLEQIDEAYLASSSVLSLMRDDEVLCSIEGMSSLFSDLSSQLIAAKNVRDLFATLVAEPSIAPQTLVAKLRFVLVVRRSATYQRRVLQLVERNKELSSRLTKGLLDMKRLLDWKRREGP